MKRLHWATAVAACLGVCMTTVYSQQRAGGGPDFGGDGQEIFQIPSGQQRGRLGLHELMTGSKPYAASGAYIDRMSDFCAGCEYDVKQKTGPNACPFNYLYWAFLIRQKKRLDNNARLAMSYKTVGRWSPARQEAIIAEAERFLNSLNAGQRY